jgi:hypothetical protein
VKLTSSVTSSAGAPNPDRPPAPALFPSTPHSARPSTVYQTFPGGALSLRCHHQLSEQPPAVLPLMASLLSHPATFWDSLGVPLGSF